MLSVTYSTTTTNIYPDDTYYVNNRLFGKYLKYVSGTTDTVEGKSGLLANLQDTIKWELRKADNGYLIRSADDTTKYLTAYGTSSSQVAIRTHTEGVVSQLYYWDVSVATGGGVLIKNKLNGKYLCLSNESVSLVSSPGAVGSENYTACVWRFASDSFYGNDGSTDRCELQNGFTISDLVVDIGESLSPTINKYPSNALWSGVCDFDFTYNVSEDDSEFVIDTVDNGFRGLVRGKEVIVTSTHKITGNTTMFAVLVNSKLDIFADKLAQLYDVAYAYQDSSMNNIDKQRAASELVFNSIRGQYSGYRTSYWPGIVGEWNTSFVDYLNSSYNDLYNYFIFDCNEDNVNFRKIMFPDTETNDYIDVFHLSATLNRLFYRGETVVDGYNVSAILSDEADDLSGWAGDLQALIRDYFRFKTVSEDYDEVYSVFYDMIGDSDYYFGYQDVIADMDACNLYDILNERSITTGDQLKAVILNYYQQTSGFVAAKRFTVWTQGMTRTELYDKVEAYCDDYSTILVRKWPILSSYEINEDQQKAFADAFVDYLILQRSRE